MHAAALAAGRIGPNAITRVAEVLPARVGSRATRDLFEHAGLLHHLRQPPQGMVDEAEVRALHGALRAELGAAQAAEVARAAGLRTADYLLAHRIPPLVQRLLKALPAPLAARMLLAAITRHAWTFAGSGEFSAGMGPASGAAAGRPPGRAAARVVIRIRHNPLCRDLHSTAPACDFYAATFERLFTVLVQPRARVHETACEACGDSECRFEIDW